LIVRLRLLPRYVIASVAKQSFSIKSRDCFVASLLAMTQILTLFEYSKKGSLSLSFLSRPTFDRSHEKMTDKLATFVRAIFLISATLLTLFICMVMIIIISLLTLGRAQTFIVDTFSVTIGQLVLWYAGVKIKLERTGEKVNRPAIYISNHSSTLDMFLILVLGVPKVRYVAKYELLYNPLFAVMGILTGQIFIKRQDSARAVATLNRAYDRIRKKGLSLYVAPEGTRQVSGKIGPFKKGAFRMAIDLQYPIVPVHFAGARQLCPGKTLIVRPGAVTIRFYPPIDTSSWTLENLDEHIARIRQDYIKWERDQEHVEDAIKA
jgi:1-acyl-sn-glycerol-3-phosphate acyltransferase